MKYRNNTAIPIIERKSYASYINDSGNLALAQPYQIRPKFDGTKLIGYFTENYQKNYAANGNIMSDSSGGGSVSTTSVSNIIGPDGTTNDVQSYPINTGGFVNCSTQSLDLSYISSQLWIFSFYIYSTSDANSISCWTSWGCSWSWPRFNYDIKNKEITQNDYSGGYEILNSNWTRVWYSTSASICNQDTNLWYFFMASKENISPIYISHVQVEPVLKNTITTPSSWIPYNSVRDKG